MTKHNACRLNGKNLKQRGFGLIEVLISMLVLTIGLVGLLSVFSFAMASTQTAQEDMIAKQLASEAMENIFTARNSDNLQWLQIQNQGAGTTPDGIFANGFQPINNPAADGLVNTNAYLASTPRVLTLPGPDGILGTADDIQLRLTNYSRSIAIASVASTNDQLRTITITVQYVLPQLHTTKSYVLSGYISQFR